MADPMARLAVEVSAGPSADAEELDATRRHWYLGFLHRAAPSRVLPTAGTPAEVGEQLANLASGHWWPDLDRLLDGVDRVVPDKV